MRLLAIMGSPRKKGDGFKVIKKLEERMNRSGNVEIDFMFISDLNLDFCRGCMSCINMGEEYCAKNNVLQPIKDKLQSYDGYIFASPVYAHGISALMKNFVDHLAYLIHRPILVNKPAMVLATTGGSGLKETLNYLKLVAVGFGCFSVGELGVITSLKETSSYYKKLTKQMDKMCDQMIKCIQTGRRRSPSLYELMFFRGMRSKARMISCDTEYWQSKGWFDKKYFVDLPIHPIKNWIAAGSEALTQIITKGYIKDLKEESL